MPTLENPKIIGSLNVHDCSVELRDSDDVLTAYLNFAQAHFNDINFTTNLGHTYLSGAVEFANGGYVRELVEYAPNSDYTYSVGDASTIIMRNDLVVPHTYKLNDATLIGTRIRLINYSTTIAHSLVNQSGGALTYHTTMPLAVLGVSSGIVDLIWSDRGGNNIGWH